jgi:hypothetical protein
VLVVVCVCRQLAPKYPHSQNPRGHCLCACAHSFKRLPALTPLRDCFVVSSLHFPLPYSTQILLSLASGDVINADFRPSFTAQKGLFYNPDTVPFRLTRNFQVTTPARSQAVCAFVCALVYLRCDECVHACLCLLSLCPSPPVCMCNLQALFTAVGVQGAFSTILVALARCLTGDASTLQWFQSYLTVLLRDEIVSYFTAPGAPGTQLPQAQAGNGDAHASDSTVGQALSVSSMGEAVLLNVHDVVKRMSDLADTQGVVGSPSVTLEVDKLIASAVDPSNIARMNLTWHPWY